MNEWADRDEPLLHGATEPVSLETLLDDDPDLWLVGANMRAWSEAHPCECEGLCRCHELE